MNKELKTIHNCLKSIIYNKDIKALENKPNLNTDEYLLVQLGQNTLEKEIQEICHNIFNKRYGKKALFVQIDNGDTAGGKLQDYQRMKLYQNKKKLGTKHGFPDVMLIREGKIAFVEFKRIGTPSQINIKEDQLHYQKWLNGVGYDSYITNNPVYFKKVILNDFDNKLTKKELDESIAQLERGEGKVFKDLEEMKKEFGIE